LILNRNMAKGLRRLLVPLMLTPLCGCGGSGPTSTRLKLASIKITPSNPSVAYTGSIQFSLTFEPSGSLPMGTVVWTSSTPHTANITSQGLAQAVGFSDFGGIGPTTISAQVDGLTDSTVLTVLPPPIHIAIPQQSPETFLGSSNPLNMSVLNVTSPDPIAQGLIAPDSWTSSNPGVATISSTGVVTPVSLGITTLTATWQGATASVFLEVWEPPARFAYVANSGSNNISGFRLAISYFQTVNQPSPESGAFSETPLPVPNSPFSTGSSPTALATDPLGKFLFVASTQSNNVSAYTIDQVTGALTTVPGSPFSTLGGPASLVVDASGKYLYVGNSTSNSLSGFAINSNGSLSPLTGFPVLTGMGPKSIAADSDEFLYAANSGSDSLSIFHVSVGSGALTAILGSPFPTGHGPGAVGVDPRTKFIYVTNQNSNSISGFTHDAAGNFSELTGSPFPLYTTPPTCQGDQPLGLAVDPQVPFAFVTVKQSLGTCVGVPIEGYGIDPVSGTLRNAGTTPAEFQGPEPAVGVDSSGRFVYVLDASANAVLQYAITMAPQAPLFLGVGSTLVETAPAAILVVK
jgi:6-phosphogluconolactonase (cycloisomerase 2 family)